ncbi:hypothetical protein SYNPS1DRAFT_28259 [Syncephalis pseudoplumigaleata]|uniref:C2 domain-containing protein n=1 Tax=Syncephalis pseudoplumigaleata TaxID=1712513 RepID=A0A4P9Z3E2_9FUNG|nr:hypothetical protein SYNPS1DRAFT_28259 [Syncephalis pseudoplumigaleata]|eukprot:RKP26030.1 hypothetical protein SYNPS1DRAFT_28259 [Syncephalis pseudoplumigaleata]
MSPPTHPDDPDILPAEQLPSMPADAQPAEAEAEAAPAPSLPPRPPTLSTTPSNASDLAHTPADRVADELNGTAADTTPALNVDGPPPPPLPQRRRESDAGGENPSLLRPGQLPSLVHRRSRSNDVGASSSVRTSSASQRRTSASTEHEPSKRAALASAIRRRFGSLSSTNLTRGSILRNAAQHHYQDTIMRASASTSDIPLPTAIGYRGNVVTNMPEDWPDTDWPSRSPLTSPLTADFGQKEQGGGNGGEGENKDDTEQGGDDDARGAGTIRETASQLKHMGRRYMDIWASLASPFDGKLDYETALDLDLALNHYANSMRSRYALSMIGFAALVWLGLYYGVSVWLLVAALVCWIYVLRRSDAGDAVIWSHLVELERGNRLVGRRAESVEWVNHVMGKLWPLINRDLFAPAIDLMEDVLKERCPSIVYAVRVDDVDQGVYPFRVRSIRVLPPTQDLAAINHPSAFADGIHLEADFIYQAAPAANQQQVSRNAHMICMLTMGVKGLAGVTVPAFVELLTCVGTCRIRLQPSADPPFVRLGNFTLMRRPRIDISVKPLRTVNIMNLPLISNYILYCINIVVDRFVWPKSYTLDIGKLVLGDDVPHNSNTVGVVRVTFHSARALRNADVLGKPSSALPRLASSSATDAALCTTGKSDAYATMSLFHNGKTRFRTRILRNELNPVWEETGFMLITEDDVRNQEKIRLQVWDADRWNSDDVLGSVEVPLTVLVASPGSLIKRTDALTYIDEGKECTGELTYSIGYYPKTVQNKRTAAGVLSVLVHEGCDLELRTAPREVSPEDTSVFGTPSSVRQGVSSNGASSAFPSSYVELIINDELTYRSRVKPTNPRPYWNCLTDRVIRDWHHCRIRIVIRDSRSREHDPVLGVVAFELSEIMEHVPEGRNMEITRWFRLLGGIGYGRIRSSLVFHSIDITIPRHLSGYTSLLHDG